MDTSSPNSRVDYRHCVSESSKVRVFGATVFFLEPLRTADETPKAPRSSAIDRNRHKRKKMQINGEPRRVNQTGGVVEDLTFPILQT